MNELITQQQALLLTSDNEAIKQFRLKLQGFTTTLNEKPTAEEYKINKLANNSKYIPISHIEMKLDEMFFGLWSTENFHSQVVANEIIGSIDLKVFHPTSGVWLTRTGCAAAMIQQKRDSDITDIGSKIKNTLVKDFPHLKAECIKNAARSLGKAFGRDLNREFEDEYDPRIKTGDELLLKNLILKCSKTMTQKDIDNVMKQAHGKLNNVQINELKNHIMRLKSGK